MKCVLTCRGPLLFCLLLAAGLAVPGWGAKTHAAWTHAKSKSNQDASTVIYQDSFDHGLDNWVWEGPPKTKVQVEDGSVMIDPRGTHSRSGVGTEGVNLWCRTPLAGDWDMQWDLKPIAPHPHQGKKANLMFIFGARYENPDLDVIKMSPKRTGSYVWLNYSKRFLEKTEKALGRTIPPMRNTTITYYRINETHDPPYLLVARHNPGLHLLKRVPQTAQELYTDRHTVTVRKRGHHITLLDKGKPIMNFDDPDIGEGYWGFRTWKAAVKLFGVKVTRPAESSRK